MSARGRWVLVAAGALTTNATMRVQADPAIENVSGTLPRGEVATISGGGFGAKPTASPVLWDDFERGDVETLVQNNAAKIGAWDSGAGTDAVTYSSAKPRTGSRSA